MTQFLHADLPHFISFGEALTDLFPLPAEGPDRWRAACGGGPWNVARAMSALGTMSAFGGAISSCSFGRAIWQASMDAHLDLRFMQQVPQSPLLAVLESVDPPSYFFVGENSADLHYHPEHMPTGWLEALRWAHFGGLSLSRAPLAERLVGVAVAVKAAGKKVSYDPNFRPQMDSRYDDTLRRMCQLADVIKVSDEDLRGLFRSRDHHVGLAQIGAWNPQAWVLVTRGPGLATLYRGMQQWQATPPAVDVEDTVGAGDATVAGFVHSLMTHADAPGQRHLAWALATGAGACTAAGANPPSPALVATLAAQVVTSPG